jgi:hypothetical protein
VEEGAAGKLTILVINEQNHQYRDGIAAINPVSGWTELDQPEFDGTEHSFSSQ